MPSPTSRWLWSALLCGVLVATGFESTAATAQVSRSQPGAMPLSAAQVASLEAKSRRARPEVTAGRNGTGENPPGRVTQGAGFSGYFVPATASTTISEVVTLPTETCKGGTSSEYPGIVGSETEPGMLVGNVQAYIVGECSFGTAGDFLVWTSADPSCLADGFCPYEGLDSAVITAGNQVEITIAVGPGGTTTTFDDLTTGATRSFTSLAANSGASGAAFITSDYCFYTGGDAQACDVINGGATLPPGFASYSPIAFNSVVINGSGLGSYLAGPSSNGWNQDNSVWASQLIDETSYVGTGDSFTVTNPEITLPSVSMPSESIDQLGSGNESLTFTATLSSPIDDPVYFDYLTVDETAFSGTDYQGSLGTLFFPPDTTTQTIEVPILPGSPSATALADGNRVYFEMQLSNPSFAASGTAADGFIYEGPVVTAVAPAVVPIDGGPATSISVTGIDFGPAGTADTVQFCPQAAYGGGGQCQSGTGVVVGSDTSLTVVAPSLASQLPATSDQVLTDTIVTNPAGISSPAKPAQDQVTFGCQQQSVEVGAYIAAGCLTDEAGGNDVADADTTVDGMEVSGSATDPVTYETGSANAVSGKPVTVSLVLGQTATNIFSGVLQKALSSTVTFSVPPNTKLAGLAISGTLSLTPSTPGQASGSVTATLPPVLGGGTGTLTFTTATGSGLTNLAISVPSAAFMQLFSVSNMKMTFTSPGTWEVSGTATTGGTTSAPFSGGLTYVNNTLKSASLQVGGISLAGLVDLSSLQVKFNGTAWSGSASISQTTSKGTEKATVALAFGSTGLTSGSIEASNVPLFGVLNMSKFAMNYSAGKWALSVSGTAGGSGGSASLNVSNGIITSASLGLTNVTFLSKLTVASATISYSASAPNSGCSTVQGTEIWCGSWDVQLPQSSTITGVSGSVAFQSGTFASGSISVSGNVALADGVFLTQLGAALTINPPPTTITGSATLSFGPSVNGTTLLSLSASLTRTFPTTGTSGSYAATGTLSALNQVLGMATITVPDNGTSKFSLTLGPSAQTGLTFSKLGISVQVTGSLSGTFAAGTFTLSGSTQVSVNGGAAISGSMKADNIGMAACAATSAGEVGFEYTWATGSVSTFGQSGCSERGF